MSAGAKVSTVALLAVIALAWGLVATSPSVERPARTAQVPEPEPESEPVAAPVAAPVPKPAAVAPKPKPTPTPTPPAAAAPAPGALEDPERGNSTAQDEDPTAAAEAERDRRVARNAERYGAARDRFSDEPRDEAWASAQERTLSSLVKEASPGDLLEGVTCKTSMCEVRVHYSALSAGGMHLLGPLAQAMGPERAMRNEGPPDQRTMVVYVPRDGQWPDEPTEGAAQGER